MIVTMGSRVAALYFRVGEWVRAGSIWGVVDAVDVTAGTVTVRPPTLWERFMWRLRAPLRWWHGRRVR